MNLALIIDDYLPHSTKVGAKMFHDLATELTSKGHSVVVITPGVNQKKSLIKTSLDGVAIWSFKSGKVKGVGKVKRAINESLLSYNAWKAISKESEINNFSGIVYYSPSIFFGKLVKKLKKLNNCKAYLVLRDLFPQWAVDANIVKKGSLIEKYFRYYEKLQYKHADRIGLMSASNLEIFNGKKLRYKLEVLHNWSRLEVPEKNMQSSLLRKNYSLEDKVIYFYGGNIGHAQDMVNLLRLVKNMESYNEAHFVFLGQGDEFAKIEELALSWKLKNFTLLNPVNQTDFKKILTEIDVGLFSLSSKHTSHNFPGKLLGYMAQSIPILGSVNPGNDLQYMIEKYNAGFSHLNGYDEELLDSARALLDPSKRVELGKGARDMLVSDFDVSGAAESIIERLK